MGKRKLAVIEAQLLVGKVAGYPLVEHHLAELLGVWVVTKFIHKGKLYPAQQVVDRIAASLLRRNVGGPVVDVLCGSGAVGVETFEEPVECGVARVVGGNQGESHVGLAILIVLSVLEERMLIELVDIGNKPPGIRLSVLSVSS